MKPSKNKKNLDQSKSKKTVKKNNLKSAKPSENQIAEKQKSATHKQEKKEQKKQSLQQDKPSILELSSNPDIPTRKITKISDESTIQQESNSIFPISLPNSSFSSSSQPPRLSLVDTLLKMNISELPLPTQMKRTSSSSEIPTRKILKQNEILNIIKKCLEFVQNVDRAFSQKKKNIYFILEKFLVFIEDEIDRNKIFFYQQSSAQSILKNFFSSIRKTIKDDEKKLETFCGRIVGVLLTILIDPGFSNNDMPEDIFFKIYPSRVILLNSDVPYSLIRFCQISANFQEYKNISIQETTRYLTVLQNEVEFPKKREEKSISLAIAGYSIGKYLSYPKNVFHNSEAFQRRNQDRIFWHISQDHRFSLILVADGVTNSFYGSGDRAAEIVVQVAQSKVFDIVPKDFGTKQVMELMQNILYEATDKIVQTALAENSKISPQNVSFIMAASVALVCILDNQLIATSLGDTRAYIIRPGIAAEILTCDATPHVLSFLYPEYELGYDDDNTLAMCVGHAKFTDQGIEPEHDPCQFRCMTIQPNDYIVLCSDGVYAAIENREIFANKEIVSFEDVLENIFQKGKNQLARLTFSVLSEAMEDGDDDASIIVAQYVKDEGERAGD